MSDFIYYCPKCVKFNAFKSKTGSFKCPDCGNQFLSLGVTVDDWNNYTNDEMLDAIEKAKNPVFIKTPDFSARNTTIADAQDVNTNTGYGIKDNDDDIEYWDDAETPGRVRRNPLFIVIAVVLIVAIIAGSIGIVNIQSRNSGKNANKTAKTTEAVTSTQPLPAEKKEASPEELVQKGDECAKNGEEQKALAYYYFSSNKDKYTGYLKTLSDKYINEPTSYYKGVVYYLMNIPSTELEQETHKTLKDDDEIHKCAQTACDMGCYELTKSLEHYVYGVGVVVYSDLFPIADAYTTINTKYYSGSSTNNYSSVINIHNLDVLIDGEVFTTKGPIRDSILSLENNKQIEFTKTQDKYGLEEALYYDNKEYKSATELNKEHIYVSNQDKSENVTKQYKTPMIGMTAKEVEATEWGKPQKINRSTYMWGIEEQWVYSNYRYVYFENGICVAVQDSIDQ